MFAKRIEFTPNLSKVAKLCYRRWLINCHILFQSERLLNPCIISVVEKSVVETPKKTSPVDKEDDVTVDKEDDVIVEKMDVEEEKVDDSSLEIVKSILEDLSLAALPL